MASIHTILEEHFLARGDREKATAVRRLAEALWGSAGSGAPGQREGRDKKLFFPPQHPKNTPPFDA